MGADSTRTPLLPAPTDSTVLEATGGSATCTDLATDLSRRTDKTSYSIPDDGSPITISARRRRSQRDRDREGRKLSQSGNQSQTSLLIEYFEDGKKSSAVRSRPSVRVKVTPSSSRKSKDQNDCAQLNESGSVRKPSYTRRISLGTPTPNRTKDPVGEAGEEERSVSSRASAPEETGASRGPPVEIEVVNQNSEVSAPGYIQPTSDISSMPADSMVESAKSPAASKRNRSHSISGEDAHDLPQDENLLKTPARRRSRSLSRERIAQKAAEKLAADRGVSHSKQRSEGKGKRRGQSRDHLESELARTPRKRSGQHRDKAHASPESSLLSNSAVSSQHKGGDQHSFQSGTSRSSLNNPKLLDTVEDAIRRLILPELKELKKDQKVHVNRATFDRDANASHASGSAASKDNLGRRLSKHASAPEVAKHRHKVSSDSLRKDAPRSPSTKKDKKRSAKTHQRTSSVHKDNEDEVELYRKKSKGLREAEAARIVESRLTSAALQHHDSQSSMDKHEESRKGSKDRSRSASVNETEVVFGKHNVPPMPFRSEVNSDLTRDSILSQETASTAAPRHGEVPRASLQHAEPAPNTPVHDSSDSTKGSQDKSVDLEETLVADKGLDAQHYYEEQTRELSPYLEPSYAEYPRRRTLSPIQSVASDREDLSDRPTSDHWEETLRQSQTPTPGQRLSPDKVDKLSIDSLSSEPSTNMARAARATTNNLENHDGALSRHEGFGVDPEETGSRKWSWASSQNEEIHVKRQPSDEDSGSASEPQIDDKYEDGYDEDPFGAGEQDPTKNAEVVHTPVGVESDVASLLDPSVVDRTSAHSANNSAMESLEYRRSGSPRTSNDVDAAGEAMVSGTPLKQRQDASSPAKPSFQQRMGVTSPPQSVAKSSSNSLTDRPRMGATGLPNAGSPMPEIGHIPDSEESEINTNPSIIQGPIGGVSQENRDHWPYDPTPPRTKAASLSPQPQLDEPERQDDQLADRSGAGLGVIAEDHAGIDEPYLDLSYPGTYGVGNKADDAAVVPPVYGNSFNTLTSPLRDEGYISGANHQSNSTVSPEPKNKGLDTLNNIPAIGGLTETDEAYDEPSQQRHLSGYSHGMTSPLYDSTTGHGIDRIQSKDIVALMDHLTVRDAQRNARDTEMLVTLVRSAAEMRNSFEDMKKFIAEQDEKLMEANEKQHGKTQNAIGGPRPPPTNFTRAATKQPSAEDDEELQSKRKNIFRRALRGLTAKNSNDLTNVEEMLVQLLSEVEALRAAQEGRPLRNGNDDTQSPAATKSYGSQGRLKARTPENQRDLLPNSPSNAKVAGAPQTQPGRHISPVMEADEDMDDLTPTEEEVLDQQLAADERLINRHSRGGSVPLATPERVPIASGALSADTTPKKSNEKARKHKSSSSSFFPKISRWSKTTASSMGENIRNTMQSARKDNRYSADMSHSGSDLDQDMYTTAEYYDHHGDDRLRSNTSLERDKQENKPPSPLLPSQVSENPRYEAHRDSLNLQHPQPRQGPTARYQNQLETEAQNFGPYASPKSEAWTSNHSLSATHADGAVRHRSSMSDGSHSAVSSKSGRQNAPPRPPKIRDDGPLVPQVPPKTAIDGSQASYAERAAIQGGRPVTTKGPNGSSSVPHRKPTGPRPYTSSGRYGANHTAFPKRQQYRGSPNQIDDDNDDN